MVYEKLICPNCGYKIGKNNYTRHVIKCDGSYVPKELKESYKLDHDDLFCKFCKKPLANKNALVQHEIRCNKNPNQIADAKRNWKLQYQNLSQATKNKMAWSRGLTKETSAAVKRACDNRPKHRAFTYLYYSHNLAETQKWIDYVNTLTVIIPNYTVKPVPTGYLRITKLDLISPNNPKTQFEHSFLMNYYLFGNLSRNNTVHHIDGNPQNNEITNLITFETTNDHKRFHNSKYAWLCYNESTHKFTCIIKKI